MATEWLTRKPMRDAVVALLSLEGAEHLLESLKAKGIGEVVLAQSPQEVVRLTRASGVDVIVLAVASPTDRDVDLLRALKEGPDPPRVVVVADSGRSADALRRRLPISAMPDALVAKPLPLAKLVYTIEAETLRRNFSRAEQSVEERPLFCELLARLWREQRTGVLRVMSEGTQTVIYLKAGVPIFAEQGGPANLLGRILVESGRITEAQLSHAIDVLTSRIVENEQLQLGAVLIELKLLKVEELYQTLVTQVRRKIVDCFRLQRYHAELREGEEHLAQVTVFESSVPEVLLAGISAMEPADVDRFIARHRHRFPRVALPVRELEQAYRLGGRDRPLLGQIDGIRRLADLCGPAAGDAGRAARVMMAMILGGALALEERPRQESVGGEAEQEPRPVAGSGPRSQFGSAARPGVEPEPKESTIDRTRKLLRKITGKHKPGS